MADGLSVKLEGVDELKRVLAAAANDIRTKAVRGALREGGKVIQAAARAAAPVLAERTKYRTPGTVRRAIAVRNSRFARQRGDEGVFVGVRPVSAKKNRAVKVAQAKTGGRVGGAYNPRDPYYWWWVEFGHRIVPRASQRSGSGTTTYTQRLRNGRVVTRQKQFSHQSLTGRRRLAGGRVAAKPFLRPAAGRGAAAIAKFMQSVVPQIEKLNRRAK